VNHSRDESTDRRDNRHKDRQLCSQVRRTLELALLECDDPALAQSLARRRVPELTLTLVPFDGALRDGGAS